MAVKRTFVNFAIVAETIQKVRPRKDLAGILGKNGKDLELGRGQRRGDAFYAHLVKAIVDLQLADACFVGGLIVAPAVGALAHSSQERPNASHQLPRREGLGYVIVGAKLQPDDTIGLLAAAGEHDRRNSRVVPRCGAKDVEAATVRKRDVENDKVGIGSLERAQSFGYAPRRLDEHPLAFQVGLNNLDDLRLVVHDEDA